MLKRLIRRTGFFFFFSMVIMIFMFAIFTIFYKYAEGLSWLDAFYFTIITTRTIGFGDISPKTVAGKIGTIFNAILPATIFFGATMAVMQMSMKKLEVGWRRYMMNRITNHDIIVTDNELLEPILAEYIANGREFVILSTKPFEDVSPHIRENLDENHYYMGDPTRNEVLEHVGVKRASTIIIALGDDSENIYTLVTARAIAPGIKTVVRVNHDDAREKFRSVGADVVLPTGTVMGRMLSQAAISSLIHQFLLGLNTHTMDPFLKESSVSVKEVGKQVREVHKRAAAVYRKNSFIYDLNNLELQKGDVVISIEKNGA